MDVSVCIVNWNTRELLRDCIKSIKEKTAGLSYEVIVVDNASSDGSAEMIRRTFPDCKLIDSSHNLGFVKANNIAVMEATGRYILYLNPDTRLVTNALCGMYTFLEENPRFGAAGCRLVEPDGFIQYTCASTFPTPFNELSHFLFLNRIFPWARLFSSREIDYWDHRDSRTVECLSGACMMVRKEIIDKLGGFDEKIYMYAEDLELCFRILRSGWKIYYLASEVIIHYEGAGSKKRKNRNFSAVLQNESNLYFLRKYHKPAYAAAYRLAVCAGSLFRITVTVILFPLLQLRSLVKGEESAPGIFSKYMSLFLWSIGLTRPRKLI